jgi:hypothetical protein
VALEHTPLDPSQLGADAQRALSSPATKMMAARGMAPIAKPKDLLALMYQLNLETNEALRNAATKSLADLPRDVVRAGLSDPTSDPRVLDLMALKWAHDNEILQLICLNNSAADQTVATIAEKASEAIIEIVATNEQRLLRCPEIISAMYLNKNARMSTVDRAVELAVRNNVMVPGLAAWEEIREAVLESGKGDKKDATRADKNFKEVLAQDEKDAAARPADDAPIVGPDGELLPPPEEEETPEVETKKKAWRDMTIPEKIRMATLGSDYMRTQAVKDPKVIVAMAALKSPLLKEKEVIRWASLQALDKRVIAFIAANRLWTKAYALKLALVNNPKTPLKDAMGFIMHLREKDLKSLSKSKNVPGPVSIAAKKFLNERKGGK